ncbi:hypothetical protein RIF23_13055 [Lipingzhangella sp. LS1_29]|uniref:Uncharacterized protein n=1 Tax=Lipingzhangella rawalii TaxID=2055835 RepID=A0ABU2H7F4_9ACTN|nr:hypothetical protein [Lipingzhangella rawalii]MDS1271225.1 hypothetical protein [Lipingzhangella rawalii]
MWLFGSAVPSNVRARLSLARGERALAYATAPDGHLVVTNHRLHLPQGRSVPWEMIDWANWTEDGLSFLEVGSGTQHVTVREPGRVPEVVQERVTATITVNQHVPLTGDGRGVRLVARRSPATDEIVWHARFDEGLDSQDAEINHRAGLALAKLRERMGI